MMEYGKIEPTNADSRKGNAGLADSVQLARVAAHGADDKKAKAVRILDIRSISSVADFFVLCSGTSSTHVRAIADNVEESLTSQGLSLHHMEGYQNGRWILLDFGDLVVHVMHEDERSFYNLERLWGDAPEMNISEAG